MDEYCNTYHHKKCLKKLKVDKVYARLDKGDPKKKGKEKAEKFSWRCYAAKSLSPDLSHYVKGPDYCTKSHHIRKVKGKCMKKNEM
jgi:hypothetical protein